MTTKTPGQAVNDLLEQIQENAYYGREVLSRDERGRRLAAAAIEASPEFKRLREELNAKVYAVASKDDQQFTIAAQHVELSELNAENERLRLRVAELEQKLQLAANNLLFPPHSEEP
jgi:thiamine biosynthesis lipoprotein ApbE